MRANRITILVRDIDDALDFYKNSFGLEIIEDKQVSESKRLVRVGTEQEDISFNLAVAKPEDEDLIGRQAGRRVFIFIDTDDLEADLARFQQQKVEITDGPRNESFGRCVLVKDLVGNTWEFVERV
tara:strand:+ start:88 stop:465 length:378 start_codon:yes stop_codon:yes gene_type:complete